MDTTSGQKSADSDLPLYITISSFLQLPHGTRLEDSEADVVINDRRNCLCFNRARYDEYQGSLSRRSIS